MLHLISLMELDQLHGGRRLRAAPAAGAEGLASRFGVFVSMDATADISAGTACTAGTVRTAIAAAGCGVGGLTGGTLPAEATVGTAAEGGTAEIIVPAAAAEAILVIGAEFRFRLALPAHILRRDLV